MFAAWTNINEEIFGNFRLEFLDGDDSIELEGLRIFAAAKT
jgi:hypothetical protein